MQLKFKIDENLPIETANLLNEAGYDAATVHAQHLTGGKDQVIASACRSEQRVLITLDLDFADIRTYPPRELPGLVVLRVKRQDKFTILSVVTRLIKLLSTEDIQGRLWIVDEKRVKVRGG
jgi:predicted nuclease of predicted toxin-antitoxin system